MRELTDDRGVDCVAEIGGPGTIAMSLKALAVGGHVTLIGASLTPSEAGLRSVIVDRPGQHPRLDQRRKPCGFRGDELGDHAAPVANP